VPAEPQSPQIGALLSALVERVDAVGVGIYDPGEDQLVAAKELPPALFSEVFSALECFEGGWGDWERTLVDDGESHVRCACGRHALELFLINGYWVLVVLTEEPFLSDAAAIIAQFRPRSCASRSLGCAAATVTEPALLAVGYGLAGVGGAI